jgi:tetratricopeptide (TPR) repeat protein
LGLIHPVKRVLRLPYFDYAEVTAARRLAELVAGGASVEHLADALKRLQTVLPNVAQPLAQLQLLARGRSTFYRDASGWKEPGTGQRVFDFDEPSDEPEDMVTLRMPVEDRTHWKAVDWFQRACALAEEGELTAAIEAFRLALADCPTEADFHFHLADALYRQGNLPGAIERYYAAVEHDRDFIEAWTQLGCVLAEAGDDEGARQAFGAALDRHPDFPDAHFHLARLLDRVGEAATAREHWRTYLRFDSHGPWADLARQRLTVDVVGSSEM